MNELCKPVHERYKMAITKVMGRNLYCLVVKDKQTGLDVIKYLKSLHLPPELILPLDNIKVHTVKGSLRYENTSVISNMK